MQRQGQWGLSKLSQCTSSLPETHRHRIQSFRMECIFHLASLPTPKHQSNQFHLKFMSRKKKEKQGCNKLCAENMERNLTRNTLLIYLQPNRGSWSWHLQSTDTVAVAWFFGFLAEKLSIDGNTTIGNSSFSKCGNTTNYYFEPLCCLSFLYLTLCSKTASKPGQFVHFI